MISYICPPIAVRILDNGVRVDLATGLGVMVPVPSGPPGPPGDPGPKGDTGAGVPPGGAAGQYFRKASAEDYDGEWGDLPDPPVPSVNGKTGPVELDADDVGALPDTTPLFSGDYDDLTNKPAIPTKVSDLTNDSGFVTALDIYPVGSIYMSVNSTSPATLFGGTWEQIKDTFLLAAGSTYAGGSTGGRSKVTLSAAIGAANGIATGICYHTDTVSDWQNANTSSVYNLGATSRTNSVGAGWNHSTPVTEKTGTSRDVNIMPPYLAVYVWKRTA